MRRAVRYGRNLGLKTSFMEHVVAAVVAAMAEAYPLLKDASTLLEKVVRNEEERFRETLEHGLQLLEEELARIFAADAERLAGEFIFKLYDTYGFPFDIVRDIARERNIRIDEAGFHTAMEDQRLKSGHHAKERECACVRKGSNSFIAAGSKTEFVGYDSLETVSEITGMLDRDGNLVEQLKSGEGGRVLVARTPFYAESGGQVGDSGEIRWTDGRAEVSTTSLEGDALILHEVIVTAGILSVGQEVTLAVREESRYEAAANHSATHLLQAALIQVLGDHVKQAGSLVGPGRLRFDFTHFSPLSQEEIETDRRHSQCPDPSRSAG